jgi:hypothetical protein
LPVTQGPLRRCTHCVPQVPRRLLEAVGARDAHAEVRPSARPARPPHSLRHPAPGLDAAGCLRSHARPLTPSPSPSPPRPRREPRAGLARRRSYDAESDSMVCLLCAAFSAAQTVLWRAPYADLQVKVPRARATNGAVCTRACACRAHERTRAHEHTRTHVVCARARARTHARMHARTHARTHARARFAHYDPVQVGSVSSSPSAFEPTALLLRAPIITLVHAVPTPAAASRAG